MDIHGDGFFISRTAAGWRKIMEKDFNIILKCPYRIHGKPCTGEFRCDKRSDTTVSIVCSKCGHIYLADLMTLETAEGHAVRRKNR